MSKPSLVKAVHALTFRNAPLRCTPENEMVQYMCLHCGALNFRVQIRETTDNGQTLICPACAIDSLAEVQAVLGEVYSACRAAYFEAGTPLNVLLEQEEKKTSANTEKESDSQ